MNDLGSRISSHLAEQDPDARVVSAYLFGSHAAGTAHAESNVDIAVVLDRRRVPNRIARSRYALELTSELIAVTHCNEVDVVVLNDVSPELASRAMETGIRVFCRDREADFRFGLQVRLRYIDLLPFLRRTRRFKAEALRS